MKPVINRINAKNPNVETRFLNLDLSDLSAVRKAATQDLVDISKIDHVVCVAGVMICPYGKTKDGFEIQLGVNYLANFLLIKLLLPKVEAAGPSSSVIIVSSSSIRHGKIHFDDIGFSVSAFVSIETRISSLTCHRRVQRMILMLHTDSQMLRELCLPRSWLRN